MRNLKIEARDPNTKTERLKELSAINWRLAAEVVRNPNVTADILSSIFSTYHSRSIRSQIIKNANCPVSLLLQEGPRHPSALLANPVLPLLLLEDPNFYEKLNLNAASSELLTEQLPESFIDWVVSKKNTYLSSCLASNPHLTHEQTEMLITQLDRGTYADKFVKHLKSPGWFLEQMAWSNNHAHRLAVAKNPSTPNNVLLEMVQYESGTNRRLSVLQKPPSASREQSLELRIALAKNPGTPSAALGILSGDSSILVVQGVACHESTEELILLRVLNDPRYRPFVLKRKKLSPALLQFFSSTTNEDELLSLLSRDEIDPSLVARLGDICQSASSQLSLVIAAHPKTPVEQLQRFATSRSELFREAVAKNQSTPPEILAKLCADENIRVRRHAMKHPSTPPDIIFLMHEAGATAMLLSVGAARRALLPSEVERLRGLGPFGERLVKGLSDAPKDRLLAWLWKGFQASLASSPVGSELKGSWLQAKDESNPRVLDAFVTHENVFLRARIASNPNLSEEQQRKLLSDDAWFVRLALLLAPGRASFVLESLALDSDVRVRRVAAKHPSLPESKREILLHDKKKKVRRAAAVVLPFPHIQKRVTCHLDGNFLLRRSRSAQPQQPPQNPDKM
jgi:hypothetical protein